MSCAQGCVFAPWVLVEEGGPSSWDTQAPPGPLQQDCLPSLLIWLSGFNEELLGRERSKWGFGVLLQAFWKACAPGLSPHPPSGPAKNKHLEIANPTESRLWSGRG